MKITEKQQKQIVEIAKKYGLTLVLFFGSQARGTTHRQSDVDIGFLAEHSMGLREIADLEFEMSTQLDIPRLELVSLGGMSSLFLQQVVIDGHVLYESNPGAYTSFVSYVFKRFIEERPLRELRHESLRVFSATTV